MEEKVRRKETLERVLEPHGTATPWLYVRRYRNTKAKVVTKYYAIFTDWKAVRRRLPLGDELKKARKKLADIERKNDAEFDFDEARARAVTFSRWADECKQIMNERDFDSLAHLKASFGAKILSRITDKDLIDYRIRRLGECIIRRGKVTARKTSPTTVNKELGFLRKLMRLAKGEHVLKGDLPKFVMDKEPNRERTLTDAEYQALLESSPEWLRRVCIGANETALSRSDLLTLTWNEIDRQNWIITVMGGRNKTKVKQQIPIRTAALTALFVELDAELKSCRTSATWYLPATGSRSSQCCYVARYRKRAGKPWLRMKRATRE